MIVALKVIAVVKRSKEVRIQGASKYKEKVHLLKNVERKEHISPPKRDEQITKVFTPWRMQKKGKGQNMEGNRPREGHSLSGEHRERDKVSIWKESNQARGTHSLEMAEGGTSQDTERKQPRKEYSPTRDSRGRDKSEPGITVTM